MEILYKITHVNYLQCRRVVPKVLVYPPIILPTSEILNKCYRLLLVEDDASFAKAIAAALSHRATFESQISVAKDLAEARELLSAYHYGPSRFDVILLDLELPDSGALDTFFTVRKHCGGIPIIVFTGRDDEALAITALKEGGQDYLVKGDIGGRELARSIQYAIERGKINAEREDFVATLTHDLKGPLQGSNRILEMLVKGDLGHLTDGQVDVLRRLMESNHTLLDMVANLLEVYRYDIDFNKIAFRHTNLINVVNNCFNEVLLVAQERSIEIRKDFAGAGDASIMADASSISRVLRNLLDNAIKFTPKGGVVTIRVGREPEKVTLFVTDTGPGIPEEDRRYLFERFYRGANGRSYSRSTGLGLYLCRQIMQQHNGTITLDKAGTTGGSVFMLEFPTAGSGV